MHSKTTTTIRRLFSALLAATLLLGGTVEARPGKSRRARPSPAAEQRKVVNINDASEQQLQYLPGIGPSKSRAIVRYRAKRKFKSTYHLIRVRGIGRKTYRKLRPHLTVKGPTTLSGKLKLQPKEDQ